MSETTKKPRTTHDTFLDVYNDDLLEIFRQDIKNIVSGAELVASREDLRLSFNRAKGVDISPSVFAEYLEKIGVSFKKTVSVNLA